MSGNELNSKYFQLISGKLNIEVWKVANTLELLSEGATIPFISRYRKEATGSLDETQILEIQVQYNKLLDMDKRRDTVLRSIEEQGKLTDELRQQINSAGTLAELEDLYLPYRPKKKTRASVARDNGLEPLAKIIILQKEEDIRRKAGEFISEKVPTHDDALQGARDIIAEWISEDKHARNDIRRLFFRQSAISSRIIKVKENEGIKYKDYYTFDESLKRCPSHRILAIFRGESEGFLKVRIGPDDDEAIKILEKIFVKEAQPSSDHVSMAVRDSYKRLIFPSIESEFRQLARERADDEAIKVFANNLRQLLLAPPLGQKRVLAIDPGFRTGCKVVCLDSEGQLLHNETIYPNPPHNDKILATKKMKSLVNTYHVEAIAIGNGTASRETESFIKRIRFDHDIQVFVVNESGASVYSTSKVARDEFPEYDVTVRGAVSIGRRLMDPLAELVKIDPKSIGVGQYQHDVDQNKLKTSLDMEVESCVNLVGVHLNTASSHLLTYVSGLGPQLAQSIITYRDQHGSFHSRHELMNVTRLGARAFELSAGFLRITDGEHPLDNSAVHPESYHIVEKMVSDLDCSIADLINQPDLHKKIKLDQYVTEKAGLPTLKDIMAELEKPGRDPRMFIRVFEFSAEIHSIEDLKEGMIVPGIVTNITNFGAFVDIGVKQDGLVHISQMADRYVSNPSEVVRIHQHVKVKILSVDVERKRIQLSMKNL
ncbi:MAG: RNA-binding protein [Bacteroides sp. SM23_62_1]|nr:MAG: RNA-binding protein [Bacteroides sp. SM23_62_1]